MMTADERAIRDVVDRWMRASAAGDTETVLSLMTDDAVFMVAGAEPFGREAFRRAAENMRGMRIAGTSEIVEIQVFDDWAFTRSRIDMSVTPPEGAPLRRSGYALSLFRKEEDGRWRLARDANLMSAAN